MNHITPHREDQDLFLEPIPEMTSFAFREILMSYIVKIEDRFSIYDSILTEKTSENMQYRVFLSENRGTDLAQLRELFNGKLEKNNY